MSDHPGRGRPHSEWSPVLVSTAEGRTRAPRKLTVPERGTPRCTTVVATSLGRRSSPVRRSTRVARPTHAVHRICVPRCGGRPRRCRAACRFAPKAHRPETHHTAVHNSCRDLGAPGLCTAVRRAATAGAVQRADDRPTPRYRDAPPLAPLSNRDKGRPLNPVGLRGRPRC